MDTDKILLMGDPQYGMSIPAHVAIKESEIEAINMLNMKPTPSIGTIGHVDHSISPLIRQIIATEGAGKDIIVIDNISEMLKEGLSLEEMVEKQRGITMELKNPYPLATVDEYTDVIGPYHRKRKPNTGLKIGSYRYKSK